MIRVVWSCGLCKLMGHTDHESPVSVNDVQSDAWNAHKLLNAPCDEAMDLDTFNITLRGLTVDEVAFQLAARVDARLQENPQ